MNAEEVDAFDALRSRLGDARFRKFVAMLRGREGILLSWQSRVLDELELEHGVVLPRTCETLGALLLPLLTPPPTLAVEAVPEWLVIDVLEGSAPVQGWGTVRAPAALWYFRSRHDSWTLSLSTDEEINPVDVHDSGDDRFHHEEDYGDLPDEASYMPTGVARFFIVRELTRWRGERASPDCDVQGTD